MTLRLISVAAPRFAAAGWNAARAVAAYITAACALSTVAASAAKAQDYPVKPVRVLVSTAAGSAPDTIARMTTQRLAERLGQSFVVENRSGAGGNLAFEAVARAEPDGYTLLIVPPSAVINAHLYPKLNYDFLRDIAPVAGIFKSPEALLVHPSVPVRTLTEFVAYARANPGKLNMGSSGNGSGSHLAAEEFMMASGTKFAHVPYRGGGQVISDLLGGQIQLTFIALGLAVEHVKAGKILALGVSTAKRSAAAPEVPAIAEAVPGYDYGTYFGLGAPIATPRAIVEKLNREVNTYLAEDSTKARMLAFGGDPHTGTPEDFGRFLAEQSEKKGKIIKAAGIKLE